MQNFINLLKFCIIQSSIKIKIINNFFSFPSFGFFGALGTFVPKLPALVTSDWKKRKNKNILTRDIFGKEKKAFMDIREKWTQEPRKSELSAAGCS